MQTNSTIMIDNLEEKQQFITVEKIDSEYWMVKALGDKFKTEIIEKIELLDEGLQGYTKIGKQVAKRVGLPFFKRNETPLKKARKEQKKRDKGKHISRKLENRTKIIKTDWLDWLEHYENEQQAIIEGIYTAELLMRDLALKYDVSWNDYLYVDTDTERDILRFSQLCTLKELWLKRNLSCITTIKENNRKNRKNFAFEYDEDALDFEFNYQYYLVFLGKEYTLFADKNLKPEQEVEKRSLVYPKVLNKEKLVVEPKVSVDRFVKAIDYGAMTFWKKHWSKTEDKLIL